MHDCSKTKDRLIDLVFDEVNASERDGLLAEMNACGECENFYRSIHSTLSVFDQATVAMSPGEDYWSGYESRLEARLREEEKPAREWTLTAWLASFLRAPRLPVAATAALFILTLAALFGVALFDRNTDKPMPAIAVDQTEPAPQPEEPPSRPDITGAYIKRKLDDVQPRKPAQKIIRIPLQKTAPAASKESIQAAAEPQRTGFTSALHAELVSHFERAQILLRSFRNIKPPTAESAFDVSYEKRMSRELIARNMLLRRNAETRDEATAKELLGQIEPLLLDIANLPDTPSTDDVSSIRELIQKQEIVAALQLYSARASN